MQFLKISFIILLVVYLLLILVFSAKTGKMLKTLLLSVASGLAVMAVINILSRFTGVDISVNAWTIGSSAVFGIPGVLGLLVLRMFF